MTGQTNTPISGRWGIPKDFDFTNVPNFVLAHYASLGVSNIQMVLIMHLASFRYDSDKTQGSRPSINTLATLMNLSYKSVLTHLQKLQEDGWVIIHSGKEDGKPSEYDFSPLTLKCLDLAKQGGMKKSSYPRYEKRFRGVRYQGVKKNSHKEERLKQKEEKEQEEGANALPPPLLTHTTVPEFELQPLKEQKTKKESVPPPNVLVTDKPLLQPMPPELDGFKPYTAFLRSIPDTWTWTHVYIYREWCPSADKKRAIYKTEIAKVEAVYRTLSERSKEASLGTATVASYISFYYSQSWVLDKAREKGLHNPREAVNLPKAENMANSLNEWRVSLPSPRPPDPLPDLPMGDDGNLILPFHTDIDFSKVKTYTRDEARLIALAGGIQQAKERTL